MCGPSYSPKLENWPASQSALMHPLQQAAKPQGSTARGITHCWQDTPQTGGFSLQWWERHSLKDTKSQCETSKMCHVSFTQNHESSISSGFQLVF
jgi:hypothetical protein